MGSQLSQCGALWHSGVPEPADIAWSVPGFGGAGAGGGLVRAGREFACAEIVERSLCLPIRAAELRGCYLEAHCYQCPAPAGGCPGTGQAPDTLLLPLGWGLLLTRAADGNLSAEYQAGAAPPADGALDAPEPASGHWLVFRAARDVGPGEVLSVQVPACHVPTQPVFLASDLATGASSLELTQSQEEEADFVLDDAPSIVSRPRAPAVRLGASRVHGTGVFAARDIEVGETVELVPTLPVSYRQICRCPLRDYVFGSDFAPARGMDLVLLPLGLGGLYNHSGDHPNVYAKRYADQPFLQAWVAQDFIPAGAEAFLAYGVGYWDAPWRDAPLRAA